MNRYIRSSGYYPSPLGYQYRYFVPTPVLPLSYQGHRTHYCDQFGHVGHGHAHEQIAESRQDREAWAKIAAKGGGISNETTALREHSLKKVLPWRANPSQDLVKDTSFYTGRGIRYNVNADSDILGTRIPDKFPDLVKGSNVMAARGQHTYARGGPKHSPTEWNINNQQLCTGAECVHNKVTMLKSEASRCLDETGKVVVRCHVDTAYDIDQRLDDIKTWTQSLKDELKFNIAQSHELLEIKERLEGTLKNIEQPLEISQENLYTRETRQGSELVRDNVEDCLTREIETFRHCEEKLLDEMDKVNAQLVRLRAARHDIEIDIRNKEQAVSTDECVRLLTELSTDIGGIIDIPSGIGLSSQSTWIANSQALIQKSREERKSSQLLYAAIGRAMLSSADESFTVWYDTNNAFKTRISEIATAKCHIENHLKKLKEDIDILKRRIDEVRQGLDEKRPLLQLAQTRMDKRKDRPGLELCRDQAMMSLLREIHSLKIAIEELTIKMNEMESTLQTLLKTKTALEHDLRIKDMALHVDREKCLCLRQAFPISTFKECRFPKKPELVGKERSIER